MTRLRSELQRGQQKRGIRKRRGQVSRREAGVWVGRVPWTYVHGYLREVAPQQGDGRSSQGRKTRADNGISRLWRQTVATPMGSRHATVGCRTIPVRHPAFPRPQIPNPAPSLGNLSPYIALNRPIEIMNVAPRGKIGRRSKAVQVQVNHLLENGVCNRLAGWVGCFRLNQ